MAGLLRSRQISSRELTEAHLAAAERDNHGLNAWLSIDRERALAEADDADMRLEAAADDPAHALDRLQPLLGIPVALKDLVSVAGGQCTAGSRILEGYRAPYDAHITERLRAAGAVILGKTNMDEFAMGSSTEHSAYGPTANPWALDRVPGGSSGGSAAAVAAFHAPLSIGTDTGGSIRQPAALCGIVGHEADLRAGQPLRHRRLRQLARPDRAVRARRPRRGGAAARGRRPRRPRLRPRRPSRCRRRCTALPAGDDEAAALAPWASAWACPASTSWRAWSRVSRRASARRSRALEAAGAIVEEVSLPHTDYGLATYYIVAPAEASANLARYDGIRYGPRSDEGDVLAELPRDPRRRASGPRSSAGSCSAPTRCRPATTTPTT